MNWPAPLASLNAMAVKPELSHVHSWDEQRRELTLIWTGELKCEQLIKLPRLRKHFTDAPERPSDIRSDIRLASPRYYPDTHVLAWLIYLDATNVDNDTDAQRQRVEQLIEVTIQDVLFGGVHISEDGHVNYRSGSRPAHTHVV